MWRAAHENVEGVQSTLRGCICTFLRVPYTLFWGCKQFLSVQYWNSVALQIHTTFICSVSLCVCFFLVCKRHFLRFLSSAVLCCYCCECINTFWGYAKHLEWFLRLAHENPQQTVRGPQRLQSRSLIAAWVAMTPPRYKKNHSTRSVCVQKRIMVVNLVVMCVICVRVCGSACVWMCSCAVCCISGPQLAAGAHSHHSTQSTHITCNTFTQHIYRDRYIFTSKTYHSIKTERVASQGRNWLQAHVGSNKATDWQQKAKQFITDLIESIVK